MWALPLLLAAFKGERADSVPSPQLHRACLVPWEAVLNKCIVY